MNEQLMRSAWDANFEQSPAYRAAQNAVIAEQTRAAAERRRGQAAGVLKQMRSLSQLPNTAAGMQARQRILQDSLWSDALEAAQAQDELPTETSLRVLDRQHDQEVADYMARRNQEQSAQFMRGGSVGYLTTSPTPDYANEFPWVNAKKAMEMQPSASQVVDFTRRQAMGSGDPFTAEDEVYAAKAGNYLPSESAVAAVRAEAARRKQAAGEYQARIEDGIKFSFNSEARDTAGLAKQRSNALASYKEWKQRRGLESAGGDWYAEDVRPEDPMDRLVGGRLPIDDAKAFSQMNEFSSVPASAPVGARPVTPIDAQESSPQRAALLAPWRDPAGYDPKKYAQGGPLSMYDSGFDSALDFAANSIRGAGSRVIDALRNPWVPPWARADETNPQAPYGEDPDSVLNSYRGRIPTKRRTVVFDPYRT
jgi:hypothetical protein